MADVQIRASVGMYENGTKPCYNRPDDVQKVVRLLNSIPLLQGGSKEQPLDSRNPTPKQLYEAIRRFQQTANGKRADWKAVLEAKAYKNGRLPVLPMPPGLWVDGHVDPHEQTLRRLNAVAQWSADDAADDERHKPQPEPRMIP